MPYVPPSAAPSTTHAAEEHPVEITPADSADSGETVKSEAQKEGTSTRRLSEAQKADLESPPTPPTPSHLLADNFAQTTIRDKMNPAPEESPIEESRRPSESSVPSLSPDPSTSASSSSVASLAESSGTSICEMNEKERVLAQYREGLYAYTKGLYLNAKLSTKKKEEYTSFGVKQSGMERLAAKKALAKRLNA